MAPYKHTHRHCETDRGDEKHTETRGKILRNAVTVTSSECLPNFMVMHEISVWANAANVAKK